MTLDLVATSSPGKLLSRAAAASLARMERARGRPLLLASAYRSTTEQAHLRAGWLARRPGFAFALPPGLSVHERGDAADFQPDGYTWLEAHAADHGWRRTNPAEPWHREYEPARDRHLTAAPPTPPRDEDDMFTDDDRAKLRFLFDATLSGGPDTGGQSLIAKLDALPARAAQAVVDQRLGTTTVGHAVENTYAALLVGGTDMPGGRSLVHVLAALEARDPAAIAAAIPDDLARQVVAELVHRLGA